VSIFFRAMSNLSQPTFLAASVAAFLAGFGVMVAVSTVSLQSAPVTVQPGVVSARPITAMRTPTHWVRPVAEVTVTAAARPGTPQASFLGQSAPLLLAALGALMASVLVAFRRPSVPAAGLMATSGEKETMTYYFLVANARFLLFDEEHAMELLREKRRFLREKKQPQDFWVVPEPAFLSSLPDIDRRVLKPCCALVSTDENWIIFMKTRYDRVLMGSFTGSSDPEEALATKGGNPLAVVPKWDVPANWATTVPYPKYSDDWFHTFLVTAPQPAIPSA
jgi:hypothetical protein